MHSIKKATSLYIDDGLAGSIREVRCRNAGSGKVVYLSLDSEAIYAPQQQHVVSHEAKQMRR